MTQLVKINVTLNGVPYEREVNPRLLLSDFIRHDLQLTGTHVGCEHGLCGACTIILDGQSIRSCIMFAVMADGSKIETVESLGTQDHLHPVQEAFMDIQALRPGCSTLLPYMTLFGYFGDNKKP